VLSIPAGPEVAQRDKADYIVPALARATKPAVLVVTGDEGPIEPFFRDAIRNSGVPFFRSPDRAMRAMALVRAYGRALQELRQEGRRTQAASLPPVREAFPEGGTVAEYRGKAWLAQAGLPVPRGALATDVEAAVHIARDIGYPVVIKAQAAALPHKSDAGGVIVGIADEAALRAAWDRLVANVKQARPGLVLDGVLVEAMGRKGVELVVGARRDPLWGPVVIVGLGGVWIEVLKDVRLLPADADEAQVLRELDRLKAAAMLKGLRGQPPVDLRAVARVVTLVGDVMRTVPQVREIDINPVMASEDGVVALDALVVCDPGEEGQA
jgi:acyl-CoA synthetase (NDP forming)